MHISEGTINTEYAGLGETYTAADNHFFSAGFLFSARQTKFRKHSRAWFCRKSEIKSPA